MTSKTQALIAVVLIALLGGALYYLNLRPAASTNAVTVDIFIVGGTSATSVDKFSPQNFTVKEGETVTLKINNTSLDVHSLAINAFGVNTGSIFANNVAYATFLANMTGTFEYYQPPNGCLGYSGGPCLSIQEMTGNMTIVSP